jgi:hypothetical protein
MNRFALLLATPFLLALTTPTVVTWSAAPVRATTRGPGQATIRIRGNIINRWHVYALTQKGVGPKPLTFTLEAGPGFSIGPAVGPNPQRAFDAEFKMNTETYSGSPEFTVPIRWTRLPAGTTELRLIVRYMACSDKLCLPPRKEALAVELKSPGAK